MAAFMPGTGTPTPVVATPVYISGSASAARSLVYTEKKIVPDWAYSWCVGASVFCHRFIAAIGIGNPFLFVVIGHVLFGPLALLLRLR